MRIKAVISYTDCMSDRKNIYMEISKCPCSILKEKTPWGSIEPRITIITDTYKDLQETLYRLNSNSIYGVNLIKWRSQLNVL